MMRVVGSRGQARVVGGGGQTGHGESRGGQGTGFLVRPGTSMLQSGLGWEALP